MSLKIFENFRLCLWKSQNSSSGELIKLSREVIKLSSELIKLVSQLIKLGNELIRLSSELIKLIKHGQFWILTQYLILLGFFYKKYDRNWPIIWWIFSKFIDYLTDSIIKSLIESIIESDRIENGPIIGLNRLIVHPWFELSSFQCIVFESRPDSLFGLFVAVGLSCCVLMFPNYNEMSCN